MKHTKRALLALLLIAALTLPQLVLAGGPSPTPTPDPGATPTPVPTPLPDIPLCTHDPTVWHELMDRDQGCRYDHFHADNPHDADAVFGTQWFDTVMDGDIDPFWNPEPGDNAHHKTMHWFVSTNRGCTLTFGVGCVTDFRVLTHYLATPADLIGVNPDDGTLQATAHTALMEARVCLPPQSGVGETPCGIARIGGNMWLGDVLVDGAVLLDFPDPRVVFGVPSPRPVVLNYWNIGNRNFSTWYPVSPGGLWRVAEEIGDVWSAVDPANPTAVNLIPGNNQSYLQPHIVALDFPGRYRARLDPDGNDIVDYVGYVSEWGLFRDDCGAPGAYPGESDNGVMSEWCIPVEFDGVPWPYAQSGRSGYQTRGEYREYDLCGPQAAPCSNQNRQSVGWIVYPEP